MSFAIERYRLVTICKINGKKLKIRKHRILKTRI